MSLQSQKIKFEFGKNYLFEGPANLIGKTLKEDITLECKCKILMSPSKIKIILTSIEIFSPDLYELKGKIKLFKNKYYYLFVYNLKTIKNSIMSGIYTVEYSSECITIGKYQGDLKYNYIKIRTDFDVEFIGESKIQQEILHKNVKKNELEAINKNESILIIGYCTETNTNSLSMHKELIPYSIYYPSEDLSLKDSINFIKSYIAFLSLFKGSLVNIKEVKLYFNKNEFFLYYPHYIKKKKNISLFTLNQYDNNNLKIFPNIDSIFLKFLKNPDVVENFDLWTLLNLLTKLKLFSVNEERFLFSYRIIEKFSNPKDKRPMKFKIKSLISNHKEISDLIKIDNFFAEQITKLRNNISHANFYYIDEDSFRDLLWKIEIFSYYLTLIYLGFEKDQIINKIKINIKELPLIWYNDSYKCL